MEVYSSRHLKEFPFTSQLKYFLAWFSLRLAFIIAQVQQLQNLREKHHDGQLLWPIIHEVNVHSLVCSLRLVVDLVLNAFMYCGFHLKLHCKVFFCMKMTLGDHIGKQKYGEFEWKKKIISMQCFEKKKMLVFFRVRCAGSFYSGVLAS